LKVRTRKNESLHSQKRELALAKKQKFALAKTEACTRKKKHNAVFTLKHAHTYAINAENTLFNTHKGHIFKKIHVYACSIQKKVITLQLILCLAITTCNLQVIVGHRRKCANNTIKQ